MASPADLPPPPPPPPPPPSANMENLGETPPGKRQRTEEGATTPGSQPWPAAAAEAPISFCSIEHLESFLMEKTTAGTEPQTLAQKRGRGRPRKVSDGPPLQQQQQPSLPKRGRGRPRKVSVGPSPTPPPQQLQQPSLPKRGRGRPKKVSLGPHPPPQEQQPLKRGRGRPKKALHDLPPVWPPYPPRPLQRPLPQQQPQKRGRGRPKKISVRPHLTLQQRMPGKRGRGRPKKALFPLPPLQQQQAPLKRGRGRPRNASIPPAPQPNVLPSQSAQAQSSQSAQVQSLLARNHILEETCASQKETIKTLQIQLASANEKLERADLDIHVDDGEV